MCSAGRSPALFLSLRNSRHSPPALRPLFAMRYGLWNRCHSERRTRLPVASRIQVTLNPHTQNQRMRHPANS
jgi:hypothetical protein